MAPRGADPGRGADRAEARRTWARRLLALALAPALLAVLELVLRAVGWSYPPPPPLVVWNADEDARILRPGALHVFDRDTLWAPRPGAEVPWGGDAVSPGGFRGEDPDPRAGLRVLALGDSSTFGYGVAREEAWPARLEGLLAGDLGAADGAAPAARPVQVVNGGLIGATAVQGLARYRRVRGSWTPDVVVAAFGAVNEHWGTAGFDDRAKLERLRRVPGSRAAGLAVRLREELRVGHVVAWLRDALRGGRVAVLQERARAIRRDRGDTKHYLRDPDYQRRVSPEAFRATLEELAGDVRADGGELVLLLMPRPRATEEELPPVRDYDPVVREVAESEGCPLADGREAFRRGDEVEAEELFLDAYHPTAEGHRRLARVCAEAVGRWLRGE